MRKCLVALYLSIVMGLPAAPSLAASQSTGNFRYAYLPPEDADLLPMYRLARDKDLLRRGAEIRNLDGLLTLSEPLQFVTMQCDDSNAYYDANEKKVKLCYELMRDTKQSAESVLEEQPELGDDFVGQYLMAAMRFVVLHEAGHALVDVLELPITGREEDAVDQLAATLMLEDTDADQDEVAQDLRYASHFFGNDGAGGYDDSDYADTHSVGMQRYYNLMCMLYGSDPEAFGDVVADMELPEDRAEGCEAESAQIRAAWNRLLEPHLASQRRSAGA